MSILMAGLAAAGNSIAKSVGDWDQAQYKAEDEARMADLQEKKQMAIDAANVQNKVNEAQQIETNKIALANKQREYQSGIIDAREQQLNDKDLLDLANKTGTKENPDDPEGEGIPFTKEDLTDLRNRQYANADETDFSPALSQDKQDLNYVRAGVETGYEKGSDLLKLTHDQAANDTANRLAAIRQQHEDNIAQHNQDWQERYANSNETQNRRVDAMFEKIAAAGATDKTPAIIQTAEWLKKNKKDPEAMAAWDRANEGKSKNLVNLALDIKTKGNANGETISWPDAISQAEEGYSALEKFKSLPAGSGSGKSPPPAKPFNPKDFTKK